MEVTQSGGDFRIDGITQPQSNNLAGSLDDLPRWFKRSLQMIMYLLKSIAVADFMSEVINHNSRSASLCKLR